MLSRLLINETVIYRYSIFIKVNVVDINYTKLIVFGI